MVRFTPFIGRFPRIAASPTGRAYACRKAASVSTFPRSCRGGIDFLSSERPTASTTVWPFTDSRSSFQYFRHSERITTQGRAKYSENWTLA